MGGSIPTVESSTPIDPEQVRRYLRAVHGQGGGQGELVLYAQRGQGGKHTERRQAGVDLDLQVVDGSAGDAFGLQPLMDGGWDVYVTPCRFDSERVRHTRRQADVCWVPGVWADLDIKEGVEGAIQDGLEMERVVRALPEPTVLVDSGSGGRHAYWLLEEGSGDPRRLRRLGCCWLDMLAELASEELGRPIQLDRVWDLARVFRVPGTWRQPGKAARDGITEPRPVRLLSDTGPRYTVETMEQGLSVEATERYDRIGTRGAAVGLDVDPADPRVEAYVTSVLEGERETLAELGAGEEGGRNSRLNRAAFVLGTLGAHGILDRDRARDELVVDACRRNGLLDEGESSCEATFNSGWDAGLGNPRVLPLLSELDRDQGVDVWPAPGDPLEVARRLVRAWAINEDEPLVRYWRGDWMRRAETGAWEEVEELAVEKAIYDTLGRASYEQLTPDGFMKLVPWRPNLTRVANVLKAMKTVCLLEGRAEPPSLLGPIGHRDHRGAEGLLVCRNGIVNLANRQLLPHNPRLFTLVAAPFDFDPEGRAPERWLRFLGDLWKDDPDQVACLQEIFGYVLSGRTDLQKIPLLVGPKRGGKGTIARILTEMVGRRNVVGVSLSSLQFNFGLEPLLDKPLAVISDARLGGGTDQLVERLLSISGEDTVTVDRKYKTSWTGRLPTRFMVLSNELPQLRDTSGAVASRFITLQLSRSWYGKENPNLLEELREDLTGIFNWSLDGLARLERQGYFTEGEVASEARTVMEQAGSPVLAFVREMCEVGDGLRVEKDELYEAWTLWAGPKLDKGKDSFSRKLLSAASVRSDRSQGGGITKRYFVGIQLRDAEFGTPTV